MADISEANRARIAALWPQILKDLAAGDYLKAIHQRYNVSVDELRYFRTASRELMAQWDSARQDSAHAFMEEAMLAVREPVQLIPQEEGKEPIAVRLEPAEVRNLVDTLKWAARVRNPRDYGDKAQLDVNVRTVDLTRIIEAANARIAQGRVIPHNNGEQDTHARALLAPALRMLEDLL